MTFLKMSVGVSEMAAVCSVPTQSAASHSEQVLALAHSVQVGCFRVKVWGKQWLFEEA